jgi:tripeptide aminopeptidase
MEISGTIESAKLTVFLRDFSSEGIEHRQKTINAIAESLRHQFKGVNIEVKHTQQYLNMKEELDKVPEVTEALVQAVKNAGTKPVFCPIRGGTDGSRLTEMGIPTPNIFTGGHEFHSRNEWASLKEMTSACKTIIELIKIRSQKKDN